MHGVVPREHSIGGATVKLLEVAGLDGHVCVALHEASHRFDILHIMKILLDSIMSNR